MKKLRLLLFFCFALSLDGRPVHGQRGAYPKMETSFQLSGVTGNPFDHTENDVRVTFQGPTGQTITVPAFFDGGVTWRVRFTPHAAGAHTLVNVTRNGGEVQPPSLERRAFTAGGRPASGFVRRDPDDFTRFRFDSGETYYPLGHNVAWKSGGTPDVAEIFARMGAAGENWSRVWMNHWDNKNLDWVQNKKLPLGTLDLDVAKRWDAIVEAAEKHGIYFQMVLQHHGQYSTRTNPNWDDNPWNAANGGFLARPEEFFTDPRARALTKAKYRYILARWGYSPHILAWELFNEVQFTDAAREPKQGAAVAAWHQEMADFLRAQDPYRHLVTTSSDERREIAGLYDAMDFVQPHAYPPDGVAAAQSIDPAPWRKPLFFGEIGPSGDLNADDGTFLHDTLWASLMSRASGAAQYWTWDHIDRRDLYSHFASAAGFVKASGIAARNGLRPAAPVVETGRQGRVSLGPGGGWGAAKQTEFVAPPSGTVEGIGEMPAYLQGDAHREMFPAATFQVDFAQPGTCAVTVREVSRAGGRLVLRVDGVVAAERAFPGGAADTRTEVTLEAKVPAGKHAIRIENTGADWLVLARITFAPYGPVLNALGKAGDDFAALWVYRTEGTAENPEADERASIRIPGLRAGTYRVTWWDCAAGRERETETVTLSAERPLTLRLPAGMRDIAAFLVRE